jgi:hypothetical protein
LAGIRSVLTEVFQSLLVPSISLAVLYSLSYGHSTLYNELLSVFLNASKYSETSIHRFRRGSENETMDPGK